MVLCGGVYSFAELKPEIPEIFPRETLQFKNPFKSCLPEKKVDPEPIVPKIEKSTLPVQPLTPGKAETSNVPLKTSSPKATINPPKLDVAGLIWNTNKPQAIINNQVANIGDVIADAEVVEIDSTGVKILFQGEYFTIGIAKSKNTN